MRTHKNIYAIVAALLLCVALGAAPRAAAQAKSNGKIAFERHINGVTDIFVINADGTGERNLTETPFNESQAAWSPDGSKMVFVRAPQVAGETVDLYVMDADGHNLKRLTSDDAVERFPAWSPDGKLIAYARTEAQGGFEQIYTVSADGFEVKNLTAGLRGDHTHPAWSPDGQRLAFASTSGTLDNYEIWAMSADGGRPAQLTSGAAYSLSPAWSPDGKLIAFGRNSEIFVLDPQTGAETNLTNSPNAEESPEWSPDGRRLVFTRFADGNLDVYVMKADGAGQRRLTTDAQMDSQPAWQPSSTQIAFASIRDGAREIFLMGEDGAEPKRLTTNTSDDTAPALSPDGRRLAFVSARDGGRLLYVMNTDGTGVVRLTNPPEAFAPQDDSPAWSPDGDKLVFHSRSRDSRFQLYVVGADGTGLAKISDGQADDMYPAWSPDGKKLAFVSLRSGDQSYDLYTVNADGTGLANLTRNDVDETDPAYSPDGTRLAYVRSCCSSAEVYVMNADGSGQTRLTNNTSNERDPAWSPDGSRVVFASLRNAINNVSTYDLYAAAADGSATTRLTTDGLENVQPSWSAREAVRPAATHAIQITVLQPGERPLAGVRLTLSGGASGSQTTDAAGFATFPNLPAGASYTVTASKDGYTFRPESRAFADLSGDTGGSFEAFRATARVGGRVLLNGSAALAGVTVHLSGARQASTVTDAQGAYAFDGLPTGGDYAVTPASDVHDFTPESAVFGALDGDRTADFGARVRTVRIGGRVTDAAGAAVAGATVEIGQGPQSTPATAATDAEGRYSFGVAAGNDYFVKVKHPAGEFTPAAHSFEHVVGDKTADFRRLAPKSHAVGGRVTDAKGSGLAGVTVSLSGDAQGSVKTDADGAYTFAALDAGGGYTLTPSLEGYTFDPASQTLSDLSAGVTVNFHAAAVVQPARVQFDAASYATGEGARLFRVTVKRTGDAGAEGSVFYETIDATANERNDYTTALGTLRFAAGETEKGFDLLLTDDAYAEGQESLTLRLSDAKGGINLGETNTATVVISDNDAAPGTNPAAEAEFFVRQHYHDFLNREPDDEGLKFWADQLTACGGDAGCLDHVRQNVSAAFFLSIEFQETGYLVHRLQRVTYGGLPRYRDLVRDAQEIGRVVVVGQGDWRGQLEANKRAFADEWAARPEFAAKYAGMSNAQFVDALWSNVGLSSASASEREAMVAGLDGGALSRAEAVRRVAESDAVAEAEFNSAFVLMEYFGYLRRNPDDRPDADMSGYRFWLDKFNGFGGDYHRAEMVKAFIVSFEYQKRFGQ